MTETFLCFYNARLVDATTDSPGMLLVEGNRIKTVALGEFSLQEATDVAKTFCPLPRLTTSTARASCSSPPSSTSTPTSAIRDRARRRS